MARKDRNEGPNAKDRINKQPTSDAKAEHQGADAFNVTGSVGEPSTAEPAVAEES